MGEPGGRRAPFVVSVPDQRRQIIEKLTRSGVLTNRLCSGRFHDRRHINRISAVQPRRRPLAPLQAKIGTTGIGPGSLRARWSSDDQIDDSRPQRGQGPAGTMNQSPTDGSAGRRHQRGDRFSANEREPRECCAPAPPRWPPICRPTRINRCRSRVPAIHRSAN